MKLLNNDGTKLRIILFYQQYYCKVMQYVKTMKGLLLWNKISFSVLGMYRHFKGKYWLCQGA